MTDYRSYTAEDFAADPAFTNWVLNAGSGTTHFWEQWLAQNPDRAETVSQAKELVLAVHGLFGDDLTTHGLNHDIRRLVSRADESVPTRSIPIRSLWSSRWLGWQAAAAVLVLLGGYWFSQRVGTSAWRELLPARRVESALIERRNTGNQPLTVLLNDGSVVTLEPNSSLSYPRVFASQVRSVNLVGEAFFEVVKNLKQPFLVFTDRSVTKVLGTSFRVRAFAKEPMVKVLVRTGRVAVYAITNFENNQQRATPTQGGVLLLPNQQVELKEGQLQKGNVASPGLVAATPVGPTEIMFDDQPVADVLRTLSRLYEINIVFDDKALSNCRITTTFAEETLPERLSSICRAIGATYKIANDKVEVTSRGCSPTPQTP